MDGTLDFDPFNVGGRPNNLNSYNSSIYFIQTSRKRYFKD